MVNIPVLYFLVMCCVYLKLSYMQTLLKDLVLNYEFQAYVRY